MKGLLNNPKFVIALAIGAFAVVGNNILSPLMSGGAFSSEEVVPPAGIEFAESASNPNAVLSNEVAMSASSAKEAQIVSKHELQADALEVAQIGWAGVPLRDPFRFADKTKPEILELESVSAAPEKKTSPVSQETPDRVPEKVNAVVIGPAFKLAVVDGELLRPGDELLGGSVKVLNSGEIEYENALGIKQTIPIQQLNLDPNTQ